MAEYSLEYRYSKPTKLLWWGQCYLTVGQGNLTVLLEEYKHKHSPRERYCIVGTLSSLF